MRDLIACEFMKRKNGRDSWNYWSNCSKSDQYFHESKILLNGAHVTKNFGFPKFFREFIGINAPLEVISKDPSLSEEQRFTITERFEEFRNYSVFCFYW